VIASGGDDLATLHREALAWARERGFRHLVCQLEASEIPAARALESAGYRLTDVVATFARAPAAFAASPLLVRAASDAEVELVADRCKAIFRAARFYTDPFYPPERADELHRRWILNCHRGGLADAFLVAVADGEVAGFSTCRLARPQLVGHMILLGVLPEFRRRGVGEALVGGTLRWFAERGAVEVRLRTQAVNQSAVNLYQRNGFRLARTELNFSFSDAP
jgi:ribosomal protein S18 acetylase RimI-like enzyme